MQTLSPYCNLAHNGAGGKRHQANGNCLTTGQVGGPTPPPSSPLGAPQSAGVSSVVCMGGYGSGLARRRCHGSGPHHRGQRARRCAGWPVVGYTRGGRGVRGGQYPPPYLCPASLRPLHPCGSPCPPPASVSATHGMQRAAMGSARRSCCVCGGYRSWLYPVGGANP